MKSQEQLAIEAHSAVATQFAQRYTGLEGDPFQNCFLYSRLRLDRWLSRYVPFAGDGLRILDAGCGPGHYSAALHERGFCVTGIDGSAEMLAIARASSPGVEFTVADLTQYLPLPNGSFDYIVCIEVLRYLPSVNRVLSELARILRPGGVCLITAMPLFNANGYWFVNRAAGFLGTKKISPLRQFFTTSSELHKQLRKAGFTTVSVHGVYTGPVNWVERLAPGLLPRFLRWWQPIDNKLCDLGVLRELSNMFLVRAVR
jgi:ubiquinone/menaquinone biosynthesis C-methylase UbiE